jgi:hypothetical protein
MAQLQRVQTKTQISRPLKVLIPLIKDELEEGDSAGHEHYRRAGEMLLEARPLVSHGNWGKWLTQNFTLSRNTAHVYMSWAKHAQEQLSSGGGQEPFQSLREMRGATEWDRKKRANEEKFRRTLREVAKDTFTVEQQAVDDEIRLHRELALQVIDLGYRALASKLHPDRGGPKIVMARLNRVRDVLKEIAKTRRFEQ